MSNHNHTRADLSYAIAAVDTDRHNANAVKKPLRGYGRYIHAAEKYAYLSAHLDWFKKKAAILAEENANLRDRIAELEAGRYVY